MVFPYGLDIAQLIGRGKEWGLATSLSCISLPGEWEVIILVGMVEAQTPYKPIREGPSWQAAQAYGIDVSLLEDSLQLTPLERIRTHARALNEVLMLQEAVRKQHARS